MSVSTSSSPSDVRPTVQAIKAQLRTFMNGVMAQSLREKGMCYHLIFGVELPRLKEVAAGYEGSLALAQALWNDDIRECRLLALLLMPKDSFASDLADIWMDDILLKGSVSPQAAVELIDCMAMYLLRHQSYASEKAFQWIASEPVLLQYAGYRLLHHLLLRAPLNPRALDELRDQAATAIASQHPLLAPTAALVLEKAQEQTQDHPL